MTSRPEKPLGADRILRVGENTAEVPAELDSVGERPAAVGIERDPGVREPLGKGADGLDLGHAREHSALELEVAEAVPVPCCFGQRDDRGRGECRLAAQPLPGVGRIFLGPVGEIGRRPVADVEQITEHRHRLTLLPLTEELCDGDAEVLPEQVEQSRLETGHGMDGGA